MSDFSLFKYTSFALQFFWLKAIQVFLIPFQPVWEKETIATLVKEINAPINILSNPGNGAGLPPSVRELQDLGVARLSLGSGLMKATLALIKKVADELSEKGTYNILSDTLTPLPDAALAYKMAIGLNKWKTATNKDNKGKLLSLYFLFRCNFVGRREGEYY